MIWTNRFDVFAIVKIFLMRYYRSSFAIIFAIFDFFNNFLRLKKLTQTSYTQILINTSCKTNQITKYYWKGLMHSFRIKKKKTVDKD